MGPGEQLWIQLVVTPAESRWRERGVAVIKKLIGKKSEKKSSDWFYFPREITKGLSESFTAGIVPSTEEQRPQKKEREWPSLMQHLSPDERAIVESIGYKIAKIGFTSKIRIVYTARAQIYNHPKGVDSIVGALKQFNTLDLNGFTVDKKTRTRVHYINVRRRLLWRKRRILWGYRYRSMKRGRNRYIMNTEELATLFHFPVMTVRAPLVQKTEAKKAEPPPRLPTETLFPSARSAPELTGALKGAPPTNLPTG